MECIIIYFIQKLLVKQYLFNVLMYCNYIIILLYINNIYIKKKKNLIIYL